MFTTDMRDNPEKTGIATDFDGTISSIVPNQKEATIDSETKELLIKLKNRYRIVAIISGRPVKQLVSLSGIKEIFYAGNHGAEYLINNRYEVEQAAKKVAPLIKIIYEELKEKFPEYDYDFKQFSLAIHYRRHKDPEKAKEKIKEILENYLEPKLKVRKGRMVYDISAKNIDKGLTVERLVKDYKLEYLLYIGDDRTDVDAFKKMKSLESQGLKTNRIALTSNETPKSLIDNSNIRLNSLAQINDLFRGLL